MSSHKSGNVIVVECELPDGLLQYSMMNLFRTSLKDVTLGTRFEKFENICKNGNKSSE